MFVQSHILNFLFGESIGYAWANLLTGRPYRFRSGSVSGDIKYAVGQPMGALSSWAMLALTHHFIVHWAAYRVGKPFGSFWDYAVLGDDIVLADGKVAGAYLQLMAQLGVGIGVHKSLVSRKGVLEFAKRFYRGSDDCSPVPFKEIVAAIVDFEAATDFVRKYKLSPASLAAIGG